MLTVTAESPELSRPGGGVVGALYRAGEGIGDNDPGPCSLVGGRKLGGVGFGATGGGGVDEGAVAGRVLCNTLRSPRECSPLERGDDVVLDAPAFGAARYGSCSRLDRGPACGGGEVTIGTECPEALGIVGTGIGGA